MTLEYHLDENDYLTFQLFKASQSELIRKKRRKRKLRVPLVYLVLALVTFFIERIALSFIFIIIGVLWYFLYPVWEKRHYVKHYQSFLKENYKNKLHRSAIITFQKDVISTKDDASEGKILTTEVEKIDEIAAAYYVHLKSGESLIIPKDKVKEVAAVANELQALAGYWQVPYNKLENWKWK